MNIDRWKIRQLIINKRSVKPSLKMIKEYIKGKACSQMVSVCFPLMIFALNLEDDQHLEICVANFILEEKAEHFV